MDFAEVARPSTAIGFGGLLQRRVGGLAGRWNIGVGEPAGLGLADFDRAAVEAKEFLEEFGYRAPAHPGG